MVVRKKKYLFRNVPAIQNTQVQLEHRAWLALAESPIVKHEQILYVVCSHISLLYYTG